jgi:nucleotide-binding universal stress UspA family protein
MSNVRKILVATDFGDCSRRGVEAAASLATRLQASIEVLHVIEEGAYAYPFPMVRGVQEAARAHLDETVASLQSRVGKVSGFVREGFAAQEICAGATEAGADLVVMGSHGRSGLPRFMHGSVAERVVRLSRVPVLTVHPPSDDATLGTNGRTAAGAPPFRHILVPVDFSAASRHGLDAALDLAGSLEARLTLVHVCELPRHLVYVTDDVVAEVETRARHDLDALLASVHVRFPAADAVLRRGNAWAEILAVAKERAADLVVLSTQGRQGGQRALIGSVAEKVVRLSPLPVLTVSASAA